jgi:uncharacterized Zn finger protein
MANPKCPNCEAEGIEYVVSEESEKMSNGGDAWFEVAYCDQCGHIYNVFPKVVYPPSVSL